MLERPDGPALLEALAKFLIADLQPAVKDKKLAFRVLNMAYHVFPDSAAAKGEVEGGTRESEQIMLAKIFKGVHW